MWSGTPLFPESASTMSGRVDALYFFLLAIAVFFSLLIAGVIVFDVYEGPGVEPGKKSIAIAVTMQPREKTMTDEEIDAVTAKITAEVTKKTGGVLRG